MLRAGGFAHSRVNMGYADSLVANLTQFGSGHFVDEQGRLYRMHVSLDDAGATVSAGAGAGADELPSLERAADLAARRGGCLLEVKIVKRSLKRQREMTSTPEGRAKSTFPAIKSTVHLQETAALQALFARRPGQSNQGAPGLAVRIGGVSPRGATGSTALVRVHA